VNFNLKTIPCSQCDAEGYLISTGSPGDYNEAYGNYLPSESYVACDVCEGLGKVEVCAYCLERLEIVHGQEACACTIALPKAA